MKLIIKKIIPIIVCLFLGFSLGVTYERVSGPPLPLHGPGLGGPPEHIHRKHMKQLIGKMKSELDLTDQQEKDVQDIFDSTRERMWELRSRVRPELEDLRKSTMSRVRKLLSVEQQEKFDKMQQKRREQYRRFRKEGARLGKMRGMRGFGMHGMGPGPRGKDPEDKWPEREE